MKNDSDIPKLTREQKLRLAIILLILIGMMVLAVVKLALLIGMWSNRKYKPTNYDYSTHVLARAFLLLAIVQTC